MSFLVYYPQVEGSIYMEYLIIGDSVHDAAEFAQDLYAEILWDKRKRNGGHKPSRFLLPPDLRRGICAFLTEEYGYKRIPARPYTEIYRAVVPHLAEMGVLMGRWGWR